MPWHPCSNSRDTITTDEGYAVNFFELNDQLSGGETPYQVKSHCRVENGQWVAWIGQGMGQNVSDGSTLAQWPAGIANSSWAWVGYFPDDGTPPTVFDLPLFACYSWSSGRYSAMGLDGQLCAIRSFLGGQFFAPNQKCEMQGWFSGALDIQVRTDGSTVWVAVLAQESVEYPWLSQIERVDRCGTSHFSILEDYEGDGNDFSHDTSSHGSGDTWWEQSNTTGSDQDDSGVDSSFRWQPARVTVFAGGVGGFNKIDVIDAKFSNSSNYGLVGHLEAAASPAEPGVLHVMWAEGGFCRSLTRFDPLAASWDAQSGLCGQRINYSQWSPGAKLVDNDIAFSSDVTIASGHGATNFTSDWIWTDEYILRNDHGSCAAFIWSWSFDSGVADNGPTTLDPNGLAYFNLSSGGAVLIQSLDPSLIPTSIEAGIDSVVPVGTINTHGSVAATRIDDVGAPGRNHFASSLYTDPTLTNTNVYLLGLNFSSSGAPVGEISAFYRIPCDGSATFTFLDGVRQQQYSIVNTGDLPNVSESDFVSDPGNIWIPAGGVGGGWVWHLTRTCERTWEYLQAFPLSTVPGAGVDLAGAWANFAPVSALNSPPSIVTSGGLDWLAAGGAVPPGQSSGGFPFFAAAVRARICRCCVPCIERIGLHVWQVL